MNEYQEALETLSLRDPEGKWRRYPVAGGPKCSLRKECLVPEYSWAIPNEEAIEALVERSPIIEIGAGNGYWTYLVKEAGGDVVAVDPDPPGEGEKAWAHVIESDHRFVQSHSNRTLFTCWPSYSAGWPAEMLELYDGDTVVYIGEGRGGCTANQRFHEILDEEFGLAEEVIEIPQWSGIRDQMYIFER